VVEGVLWGVTTTESRGQHRLTALAAAVDPIWPNSNPWNSGGQLNTNNSNPEVRPFLDMHRNSQQMDSAETQVLQTKPMHRIGRC